jgi:hypothetical protein
VSDLGVGTGSWTAADIDDATGELTVAAVRGATSRLSLTIPPHARRGAELAPGAIALASAPDASRGDLWLVDSSKTLRRISPDGVTRTSSSIPPIEFVVGMSSVRDGQVLIAGNIGVGTGYVQVRNPDGTSALERPVASVSLLDMAGDPLGRACITFLAGSGTGGMLVFDGLNVFATAEVSVLVLPSGNAGPAITPGGGCWIAGMLPAGGNFAAYVAPGATAANVYALADLPVDADTWADPRDGSLYTLTGTGDTLVRIETNGTQRSITGFPETPVAFAVRDVCGDELDLECLDILAIAPGGTWRLRENLGGTLDVLDVFPVGTSAVAPASLRAAPVPTGTPPP